MGLTARHGHFRGGQLPSPVQLIRLWFFRDRCMSPTQYNVMFGRAPRTALFMLTSPGGQESQVGVLGVLDDKALSSAEGGERGDGAGPADACANRVCYSPSHFFSEFGWAAYVPLRLDRTLFCSVRTKKNIPSSLVVTKQKGQQREGIAPGFGLTPARKTPLNSLRMGHAKQLALPRGSKGKELTSDSPPLHEGGVYTSSCGEK